jgi:hypothetical protein
MKTRATPRGIRVTTSLFELLGNAQRRGLADDEIVEVIEHVLSAHRARMGGARVRVESPAPLGLRDELPASP